MCHCFGTASIWQLQAGASSGQKCGVETHDERTARAFNGNLGGTPSGLSGIQSSRSGGEVPVLSCKSFPKESSKIASFAAFCKLASQAPNMAYTPSPLKNSPDLHQSEEQPLSKVGMYMPIPVHPAGRRP